MFNGWCIFTVLQYIKNSNVMRIVEALLGIGLGFKNPSMFYNRSSIYFMATPVSILDRTIGGESSEYIINTRSVLLLDIPIITSWNSCGRPVESSMKWDYVKANNSRIADPNLSIIWNRCNRKTLVQCAAIGLIIIIIIIISLQA